MLVVSGQCSSNQQQSLLLQLKNSLNFEPALSSKLVKWNNVSDYCSWQGVSCKGGCVTHLDLSSESISGELDNSSALFGLQYIEHLNLANNNFNYTQIPSQFNKLASLNYLNLSNASFAGQIPIEISHLTRLVILDLSTWYFPGLPSLKLEQPNLRLVIGNLSEINELYLDGVNISAPETHWSQAISSSLPNLRVLSLSSCNLSDPIDSSLQKLHSLSVIHLENNYFSSQVPEFLSNFSNLTSLRLGYSRLNGTFPEAIFQVPTLETIDLSNNVQLQGSLPEFKKNRSLRTLVLSRTNFSGLLPDSIGELKMLSRIDLSFCNFTGGIPSSMENLTELVYLDMSNNRLNGSVPLFNKGKNLEEIILSHNDLSGQINCIQWESLINLINLNLGDNKLDGTIPLSLFSLPLLQRLQLDTNQFSGQLLEISNISSQLLDTLDLSSNNLEGPIPVSITKLQGLKILSLSFNNFSGSFALDGFQKLKNLSRLELSYNSLLISYKSTSYSYSSFPNITTLALASCKLRKFPDFLRYQSTLRYLDLSQNQIHGEIPNWVWRLSDLHNLNLSCNSLVTLEGPILHTSSTFSSLSVIDLHSNQFQGQIPILPPSATYLDYSRNNFSSTIPSDIGNSLNFTTFFSLSSNNFHGIIPGSICNASYLQVLDLSNNSLCGKIPECLSAMVSGLAVLNLRRNNLVGSISDNFPGNCNLETLDLNGNLLEGKFPKSLAQCAKLEVLNLGNNQMTDSFPYLLRNISSLRVLILRSNNYFGRFDCHKTNGTWPMLQIIDLANNSFTGDIPGNCLTTWRAMMVDEDASPSVLNQAEFRVFQFSELYYWDALTITSKGLEVELVKILNIYTSVDFSCNKFSGSIPKEMGGLISLYALNLSSNTLTGEIPSSLANLKQLESLDLSKNNLSGQIPEEFAKLNFLSSVNLSYNQLVGLIPTSTQFSTLPASSFEGNKGLWGPPLTGLPGKNRTVMPPPTNNGSHSHVGQEIDWDFLSVEIGFVSGFGIAIGSLLFCKKWRKCYYRAMYSILVKIFPQLEQRLGNHRRHVYINPRWRS
ncbi:receptor-like protein 53 [Rosa rugosa]|uniref:receptor-like protein 53 n=1 Tax=Rosa rugosa TaxID=74645 RepID=UPI002B40544C|nr:receptor-like protein 53 [Rosa rugosa]